MCVLNCFPSSSVPWVGLILCQGAELETVRLCQQSRSRAGVVGLSSAAACSAAGQLSGVPGKYQKGASDTLPSKQQCVFWSLYSSSFNYRWFCNFGNHLFIKNLKTWPFTKYTQRQRNGDEEHKVLEHVALICLCVNNHEHSCPNRLVFLAVLSVDLVQGETEQVLIHWCGKQQIFQAISPKSKRRKECQLLHARDTVQRHQIQQTFCALLLISKSYTLSSSFKLKHRVHFLFTLFQTSVTG